MLDFTSALYLDLQHASRSLPAWERLTEGRPAALEERPLDECVARDLAALQGCQAAILGTSTLHLFWDLGGLFAGAPFLVDAGTYAVGWWGAERAQARGSLLRSFGHYDAESLGEALGTIPRGTRPIILFDGFCPGCGRAAPVPSFLELTRPSGAVLLIDDTQSLGVHGHSASARNPYGFGGGGSPRRWGISDERVLFVSSLAKAFGAPIAAISGSAGLVHAVRAHSATRVQCSPPSAAHASAALAALRINRQVGDRLRDELLRRVLGFRCALEQCGLRARGGTFPVQTLEGIANSESVHAALMTLGVRTVLHRSLAKSPALISFVITAKHRSASLKYAAECIAKAVKQNNSPRFVEWRSMQRKGNTQCGRLATENA